MPIYLTAESELHVGQGSVTEAPAEAGTYVVVFEDDEDTGYFYALDTAAEGNPIQDALHIYNVADVSDKHKPSSVKIGWSVDHSKAALLINDYPHLISRRSKDIAVPGSRRKATMAGPSVATNGMIRRLSCLRETASNCVKRHVSGSMAT